MKSRMSSGSPRSFITALRILRTGVRANIALRTERGMKPSSAALMRIAISGACAARAKVLSRSPTRIGVGSVR
ncbi:MAG: hypothetical protein AW12_02711 [Candidatus Accumulibacter sp. BA-94]|nr:MAG: hypothetical protein AW12_02711 [Candidatus Accumulibacter sp. BA-94]